MTDGPPPISEEIKHLREVIEAGCYHRPVLVFGDVLLERCQYGRLTGVAHDTSVPVVQISEDIPMPGGAAKIAVDLRNLGCTPLLCGLVGKDPAAMLLSNGLEQQQIDTRFLLGLPSRPTAERERVRAGSQWVACIERGERQPLNERESERLLGRVEEALAHDPDAIVIADGGRWPGQRQISRHLILTASERDIPTIVAPASPPWAACTGANVLVLTEAQVLGASSSIEDEHLPLKERANNLRDALAARMMVVVHLDLSLTLIAAGAVVHVPSSLTPVHDKAGTDETVLAMLGAVWDNDVSPARSVQLAALASALTARRPGLEALQRDELLRVLEHAHDTKSLRRSLHRAP